MILLQKFRDMFADETYLRKTWMIALPVTLQTALNMVTNMVDTVMIGRLGETAIASVGLANKVFFVYILLVFGTAGGMGVLAAQYWGAGDTANIRRVLGLGLIIALSCACFFTGASFFAAEKVIRVITHSDTMIRTGAVYLQIVCLRYPPTAVSTLTVAVMRAMGRVKEPVLISMAAIAVNIFFNYGLIFGKLGMPAMGVAGAAAATVIARVTELALVILVQRLTRSPLWCSLRLFFGFGKDLLRQFARNSLPVIFNEFLWGIGITMYSLVYGRMGDSPAAAMTIVQTFSDIEMIGIQGLFTATAVILGNEMGAGQLKRAERYASYDLCMAFLVSIALFVITMLAADPFIRLFAVPPDSAKVIRQCLLVFAASNFIRCQNTIIIVGILRSGGDTIACSLLDLLPLWLVGVPLTWMAGLVWKLPLYLVYMCSCTDELVKLFIGRHRYHRKKWLKNLNAELTGQGGE